MKTPIGRIVEKANLDEFCFAANRYFSSSYVEVMMEHVSPEARMIGEITSKEAINPYFDRPSVINYATENDESIKKHSFFAVKVKPLSIIRNGKANEVDFPPLPGSNVFEASKSDIQCGLRIPGDGVDLGCIKGHDIEVFISYRNLIRTHISIIGQTGSGKSYLAAKIALELIKLRRRGDLVERIAIPIFFDTSGEYSGDSAIAPDHSEISMILNRISIGEHHFPLLNEKYLGLLYEIFDAKDKQELEIDRWVRGRSEVDAGGDKFKEAQSSLIKQQKAVDLFAEFSQLRISTTRQLADRLEEYLIKYNRMKPDDTVSLPYNVLNKLRKFNLKIKRTDDIDIMDNLSNGLIIDLSKQEDLIERQIVMKLFLAQLLEAGKAKKLKSRVVLFIDEAHNYVPSVYRSYCKEEILRVAREGRKHGLTLCLVSQRPRWVDPTALSQCGNIFIFRIQNSEDKKHVFDSGSLPDSITTANIGRLKTGEMIIAGDVSEIPMTCVVSEIDRNFIRSEMKNIREKHLARIGKILGDDQKKVDQFR